VTNKTNWRECWLYDLRGERIGSVRVPCEPFPPGIIKWTTRYFILTLPEGDYAELVCYQVAAESVRQVASAPQGLPFRKPEK
jgi:hypothetical protein